MQQGALLQMIWGLPISVESVARLQQVASAALAADAFEQRAPVEGDDEITQLGGQYNRMADQLTAQCVNCASLSMPTPS